MTVAYWWTLNQAHLEGGSEPALGVALLARPRYGTVHGVDEGQLAVRRATYGLFVEFGRAPTADEVGQALSSTPDDVRSVWRQLHGAHALVLHAGSDDLRMANPFSAAPTAHRVYAAKRWWYANCAWDAIGICSALHVDGRVVSSCPDCGDTIELDIQQTRPSDETLLFGRGPWSGGK